MRAQAIAGVVVLIIVFLGAASLLFPACIIPREVARRMQCGNNVKQLSLGLQNYHDTFLYLPYGARNRTLPPAYDQSSWGNSWLVATIPFCGINRGYDALVTEAIIEPDNDYISIPVRQKGSDLGQKIKYMLCPSSAFPEAQTLNGSKLMLPSYAGILGAANEPDELVDQKQRIVAGPFNGWVAANGMLPINDSLTFEACTDGTANTIIVGEVSDWYYTDAGQRRNPALSIGDAGDGFNNAAGWPAGTDLDFGVEKDGPAIPANRVCNLITIAHPVGSNNRQGKRDAAPDWGTQGIGRCGLNNPLLSAHPAGAMVGFLDGHVMLLTKQTSTLILKRLANRDDGGEIPDF